LSHQTKPSGDAIQIDPTDGPLENEMKEKEESQIDMKIEDLPGGPVNIDASKQATDDAWSQKEIKIGSDEAGDEIPKVDI